MGREGLEWDLRADIEVGGGKVSFVLNMRYLRFLIALGLICTSWVRGDIYTTNTGFCQTISVEGAVADSLGRPAHVNLQHLQKNGYIIEYDNYLKGPAMVTYILDWSTRNFEHSKRPEIPFETDMETEARVSTRDYTGAGYDRGHMCPSFAMGAFYGRDAQSGTFVCSNILPQSHLCNAGVWNSIERMEADDFAKRFGRVKVICGPVYSARPARIRNGIAVPEAFFKVIVRPDGQVISFLVPQQPGTARPDDYLTSLQNIRDLTGLPLAPEVGDEGASVARKHIW